MTVEQTVEKYHKRIYDLIYYSIGCNHHDAEDYTSEVFCAMIASWEKIDHNDPYPWLLRTTYNKLKEYNRFSCRQKRLVFLSELMFELREEDNIADNIISDEEIEEMKAKILSMLSEDERTLYEDYFTHKMKYDEIAQKLGTKYNAVSARMVKLRKKIEKAIFDLFGSYGGITLLRLFAEILYRD